MSEERESRGDIEISQAIALEMWNLIQAPIVFAWQGGQYDDATAQFRLIHIRDPNIIRAGKALGVTFINIESDSEILQSSWPERMLIAIPRHLFAEVSKHISTMRKKLIETLERVSDAIEENDLEDYEIGDTDGNDEETTA